MSGSSAPLQYLGLPKQSYGIFDINNTAATCSMIGVQDISSQLAIFVCNTRSESKECLAICAENYTSIQAIKNCIAAFMARDPDVLPKEYKVSLVGGLRANDAAASGVAVYRVLVPMLRQHFSFVDILDGYFLQGDRYSHVLQHIASGEGIVYQHWFADGAQPVPNPDAAYMQCLADCQQYLSIFGKQPLAKSVSEAREFMAQAGVQEMLPETEQFFTDRVANGNGTPLLPCFDLQAQVDLYLHTLGGVCGRFATAAGVEADAQLFARTLANGIANPVSAIAVVGGGFTPLHYACIQLKKRENEVDSYKLKAIIVMLLLFGMRDLPNEKGTTALSYLLKIQDQEFAQACMNFIQLMDELRIAQGDDPRKQRYNNVVRQIFVCMVNELMIYDALRQEATDANAEYYRRLSARFLHYLNVDKIRATVTESTPAASSSRFIPQPIQSLINVPIQNWGIFNLANTAATSGLIGANGPDVPIVVFVWHPSQTCLMLHFDHCVSEHNVELQVRNFLDGFAHDEKVRCKAFVAGGNADALARLKRPWWEQTLTAMLRANSITSIDLSSFGSATARDQVCFNVTSGQLVTGSVLRAAPDPRGAEAMELTYRSGVYLVRFGIAQWSTFLDELAKERARPGSSVAVSDDTLQLFRETIIPRGDGTPLLSFWDVVGQIREYTEHLHEACRNRNVLRVAKLLANGVFNPVLLKIGGATTLHIACEELRKADDKMQVYKAKAIITMLLVCSAADEHVTDGSALTLLNNIKDQTFKRACETFVRFLREAVTSGSNAEFQQFSGAAVRGQLLILINEAICYQKLVRQGRGESRQCTDLDAELVEHINPELFRAGFAAASAQRPAPAGAMLGMRG